MSQRWSAKEANSWWANKPWICGFNYLPSSAVNFLEMWQGETFDLPTIERELNWAADAGFNSLRVNPHFLVWKHDRDGLLDRMDRLMDVAARNGLSTVPCPFDDCGFGGAEPIHGPQPDPVPGVHNSRAVASPGRATVMDPAARPDLEAYIRDVVGAFRTDDRVLFWDVYNEPGNRMIFRPEGYAHYSAELIPHAKGLMEDAFGWVRSINPEHPVTVGAWITPLPGEDAAPYQTATDQSALALSDIVTFHAYWNAARVADFIDYLEPLGRPMLCTEWMARAVDSRIADQLKLFHDRKVGCFQWGLVKGRTQTHIAWPEDLVRTHGDRVETGVWFHDLFHEDGTPYDMDEIETVRTLTTSSSR